MLPYSLFSLQLFYNLSNTLRSPLSRPVLSVLGNPQWHPVSFPTGLSMGLGTQGGGADRPRNKAGPARRPGSTDHLWDGCAVGGRTEPRADVLLA